MLGVMELEVVGRGRGGLRALGVLCHVACLGSALLQAYGVDVARLFAAAFRGL